MQWAKNFGQRLQGYAPGGSGSPGGGGGGFGGGGRGGDVPSARDSAEPPSASVATLVQQATSELLIGPDWSQNLELVDTINRGTAGGNAHEQALKHLKKPLTSSNPHQQLLALTVLDTCAKNCGAEFHRKLAFSEVWAAMQMMTGKTNQNSNVEVKNKALEMIEDWANGLSFPTFRDHYNILKAKDVTFPPHIIAKPSDFVAVQPPPPRAGGEGRSGGVHSVPAGLSDEDRAAIEAAMAEFAAEDASHSSAVGGYHPPVFVPEDGREVSPELGPVAMEAAAVRAAQPLPEPTSQYCGPSLLPDQSQAQLLEDLETTKVTVGLLEEMLNAVPAGSPGEALADHVREVAEQVLAMRPRVHRLAEAATDEQVLMAVIGLNEQLEAALLHNDQLVAAAAAATAVMQSRPAAASTAAPAAPPPSIPPPPAMSKPLINLMDREIQPPSGAMQTQQAVTDPFLPVSIGAPGNDLAACFDQMVVLQPAAAAEDPKPAGNDANDFDVLTHPFANMRSGPSNYVQEDATGKGEQEPQKDFKGKAAADPADL